MAATSDRADDGTAAAAHPDEPPVDRGADSPSAVSDRVAAALAELDIPIQREGSNAFLVTMPGERKYRTLVWLIVGAHELLIESFICRRPDENLEDVYRYLLQRNAALRTVAYAIDGVGDIHLVGRISLAAITPAEINTLLGVVLETSDRDFNPILERGFADAIRREWAWRTARGDSVKNLSAFTHLIDE